MHPPSGTPIQIGPIKIPRTHAAGTLLVVGILLLTVELVKAPESGWLFLAVLFMAGSGLVATVLFQQKHEDLVSMEQALEEKEDQIGSLEQAIKGLSGKLQAEQAKSHAVPSVEELLLQLSTSIEYQESLQQAKVNQSLEIGRKLFFDKGPVKRVMGKYHSLDSTNQLSGARKRVELPCLSLAGKCLSKQHELVNEIQAETGCSVTIFQKIQEGYIRVATTILQVDGSPAVGTYIPNSSPVIETVENGEVYTGRAFVVNAWYASAYEPYYVDGKLAGMIYVGIKEENTLSYQLNLDPNVAPVFEEFAEFFCKNVKDLEGSIRRLVHFFTLNQASDQPSVIISQGIREIIGLLIQARFRKMVAEAPEMENGEAQMESVTDFIRNNLTKTLSVEELADMACMSQSSFFRYFKNAYGQSPGEYILKERMKKAEELLQVPGKSVSDVCYEAGFSSPSYFIRIFKRAHGFTPKQFQKQLKQTA
ncbi:MAG: Cache 3/Cache 2 fusion domain-containing protein [Bacteroidota bacterium]